MPDCRMIMMEAPTGNGVGDEGEEEGGEGEEHGVDDSGSVVALKEAFIMRC